MYSKTSLLALSSLLPAIAAAQPSSASATAPLLSSPFGSNVYVYSPATPRSEAQAQIDRVYGEQQHSEFGRGRYAFLLLPGDYQLNIPIGFYTQVLGLGASPDAVHVTGNVHVDAAAPNNNATTTFWRAAEGFSITPTETPMRWAVSQAVSFRRMHVLGDMVLNQDHGWASGGWMSDTVVDGNVASGTQQQWISRNVEWKSWTGSNWNMVFVGAVNEPAGSWPTPAYTKIEQTPVIREKPFLEVDGQGRYSVVVPALAHGTRGVTWHGGSTPGRAVPLRHFFIAQPGRDSASEINRQLARGKDLLLTPGIYDVSQPIRVTHRNAVVLGLGYATLHPTAGTAAMEVADQDGITVSGLLFDAGEERSPVLLTVGSPTSHNHHASNPISLHDIFFRVGGAGVGNTIANLVINSSDTIVDHTWIWRADHGEGVGWDKNHSANGLIVNGSNVTIYGLFVEHHQQYQVLWNGNGGRTYFYQSEIPYDPPNQGSWRSAPGTNGWASYKVADGVTSHEAWGLGVYSVFRHPDVILTRALETPALPGVRFHDMVTVALDNLGEITHIIDDKGAAAQPRPHGPARLSAFP